MGRLIDPGVLLDNLSGMLSSMEDYDAIRKVVNNMPTAYDVDAVVEQKGYNKAIDDFEIWLKTEKHKAIDAQTGELLIARDGIWVDAFETFKKDATEQWNRRVRS